MTHSHTNPDATQQDMLTASSNLQEKMTCTTTLQFAKKRTEAASLTAAVDLAALITQHCNSIDPRLPDDDRDILCFCLHHLFISIDMLVCVAYRLFTEQVSSTDVPLPTTTQDLIQRRAIWMHLQDIKRILERMEPLCQLLNDAGSSMLSSLDTQTNLLSPTTLEAPDEPSSASNAPTLSEQLQDVLIPVLDNWQQCLSEQHTFHHRFAHLHSAATPALLRIDRAFSPLLQSACSLFHDTLPAFSTTPPDATTTLLFDLMQKVDQILLQIDVMMAPLQTLSKYHSLGTEVN